MEVKLGEVSDFESVLLDLLDDDTGDVKSVS